MASAGRVDFTSQIQTGELIELLPWVTATGHTSLTVVVDLWAESLRSLERRLCGAGTFVMVAVDDSHQPRR